MVSDTRGHRRFEDFSHRLARLSIFTGGKNLYGKTKWISLAGIESADSTVIHIAQVWVEKSKVQIAVRNASYASLPSEVRSQKPEKLTSDFSFPFP
jgi:hypothetical protein